MRAAISPNERTSTLLGRPSDRPEALRADQRAVHDQIGVAADGRGEMRVAAQIEPEMAVVLGRVLGLRLTAQHHLVDELLVLGAAHARQDAVEIGRPHRLTLGELDVERRHELAQRLDLFRRWLVVHAIDQRHAGALQRLGRRDVGENHEFLDQPVRVEAWRSDDAVDRAVGLQNDLALWQVEIERLALVAFALYRAIGRIKRLDHA